MADKSKGTGDGPKSRNEDDMSAKWKRKTTADLNFADFDFEVEESGSSDDDVDVGEGGSCDAEEINSIFVKITIGKTISLEVKGSDTISNIKAKIQDKEHIPLYQQELVFHEMVLDDTYTLANLSIRNDSVITLMRKLSTLISIDINNLQGELLSNSLKVKPLDTIRDVKAKLCCLDHVLAFNGNVLDDCGTLADFHIPNGSTLTLIPKYSSTMFELFVKTLTGNKICLSVYPTDTIAKVRSKIEQLERIPCDEHVLIFKKMVLDESSTLSDFHINRKSVLKLMLKSKGIMKIFIKTITKEITLEVKPSDTIDNVKAKIYDQMRLPRGEQVLTFNKVVLDNMSTLADLQITNGSTLALNPLSRESMLIFIKPLSGKTITLCVKHTDTINI